MNVGQQSDSNPFGSWGWLLLGWLLLGAAHAASFDCGKAQTKVEKLICVDQELSKLDEELAVAYREALDHARLAGTDEFRQEQKSWLKEYRNKCTDADCLKRVYRQRLGRIAVLMGTAETSETPGAGEACHSPKIDWRNYTWTLITGKGLAACEDMLAWLKSRPKDAPPPVCPEDRLPPNGHWSRPEARILSEAEKQALIAGIPEKWRKFYEGPFKRAKLMRAIRGDITMDGIPETMLAYSSVVSDRTCRQSVQCASTQEMFEGEIVLYSEDEFHLLPMNYEGTQVAWSLGVIGSNPMLMFGDLVYYKGKPYWLSSVKWNQSDHDHYKAGDWPENRRKDYERSGLKINRDVMWAGLDISDPNNAMFGLYEVSAANSKITKGIGGVGIFHDPEDRDNPGCRFGYFHREALKLQRKGR